MKLYRYIPLSRLLTLVSSNTNVLRHPTCWDDPFESVMFRVRTVRTHGLFFNKAENRWQSCPPDEPGPFETRQWISDATIGFRGHFYCQCWTRKPESDAMWRVYSQGADLAARITVDRDVLLQHMKRALGEQDRVLLEDVTYHAEEEIEKNCRAFSEKYAVAVFKRSGMYTWFDSLCELMRLKRQAFDYEDEARLMLVALEQLHSKRCWNPEDVPTEFSYYFPVNELIEEIMLHPSYPREQMGSAVGQIADAGYRGPIRQSDLYAPRNFDHVR